MVSYPRYLMSFELSTEELSRYEADGFLVREAVFAVDELAELREAAEQSAATAARLCKHAKGYRLDGNRFVDVDHVTVQFEHEPKSDTVRVIEPVHQFDRRFARLIDDPRIVQPMRALVGCDRIALWTDKLNLKRPYEGSGFRWHQDSPYWVHDCAHVDQLPNVLLALDDATEENGCLRVVRGSHPRGCLSGLGDETQLGGFFTNPAEFDESQQVPMVVPAGSLIFFSPHAVHGSSPNRSSQPRRALVLTYQPGDHPTLKSGEILNVG